MHEITIARKIVEDIKKHVKNLEELEEVEINVGEIAPITSKELMNGLNHIFKEHLKLDVKLSINEKKSIIKCKDCGYKGRANIVVREHDLCIYNCPVCKSFNITTMQGDELEIHRIKIKG